MKKKTKMMATLEIVVVLCSVLLVALPLTTIAAEQDDYILGIYGNANEDDTIDMRDLTYVKLIFFGKKPETELADAKYDGKINPLDFIQIKLIIVGKEKELTIVDSADRTVTVKKPVKRIIPFLGYDAEALRMLGEQDKIVGVSTGIAKDEVYFPELSKLPSVGSSFNPDLEAILSLNPNLVNTWSSKAAKLDEDLPGVTVIGLNFYHLKTFREEQIKFGYIFNKENRARDYLDDFHDKYINLIKVRTKGLSEEKKPKVYVEGTFTDAYQTYSSTSSAQLMLDMTSGINLFADLKDGCCPRIDPEEVVERNPDIIIRYTYTDAGYNVDEPSKTKALRDTIMNRPELANINAVKNGKVYIMSADLNYGLDYPVAIMYWAKWFHPDLFSDLDPQANHQEFLTRFQGLDIDLDEKGVFVYHPNGN